MNLQICLLGPPTIVLDDDALHHKLPAKACALLYFLAVTRQSHSRASLAALFWGAMPEKRARNNLSIVLTKLRQFGLGNFLNAGRNYVSFQDYESCDLDLFTFESLASQLEEPHSRQQWQAMAQLYRGDFLADFFLSDEENAVQFNKWQQSQLARLQTLALKLFDQLMRYALSEQDYDLAVGYIEQQLAIEPWREEAHRQKMRLLAHQGQKEQAVTQYLACQQILAEELGVDPAPETEALYQQILQGEVTRTKIDGVAIPFQAPALPHSFVGRETLLNEVASLLTDATTAPIALVGMGGIGKTTLVTQLAYQMRSHFRDGILWAHANEQDLYAIVEQWGTAFGRNWSHIQGFENRAAAFRNLLTDKQVLIVLDDLSEVSQLRLLLPNSPRCAVLITTRDHDLAHALDARLIELSLLAEDESVQLLSRLVGEERVAAELKTAVNICRILEHLPLAVEIMGQRLRSRPRWPLSRLLAELQNIRSRLDALRLKDRAVRTSFELSWQLLATNLADAFALLAPFAGRNFTEEAATAVSELDSYRASDALESLVALSLVSRTSETHYRQHALLADFAYEKISQTPERYQRANQRITSYYYQFAAQHIEDYDTLRPEWPNIHAAIQTAYDLEDWRRVHKFTETLTPAWFARARYSEARHHYALGHEATNKLQDQTAEAHLLLSWAKACIEQDAQDEANEKLLQGLEYFRATNDHYNVSETLLELGRIAIEKSELEEAHQWLLEAKSIKEQLNDSRGLAFTAYRIARLHSRIGDWKIAHKKIAEALTLAEKQDQILTLKLKRMLAFILLENGEHERAILYGEQALELARQTNHKDELATTLYYSMLISARRDFSKADAYAAECLYLFEEMGAVKMIALTRYEMAIAHWHISDLETALALSKRSLSQFRDISEEYNQINVLFFIGLIEERREKLEAACKNWHAALTLAINHRHKLTKRIKENLEKCNK